MIKKTKDLLIQKFEEHNPNINRNLSYLNKLSGRPFTGGSNPPLAVFYSEKSSKKKNIFILFYSKENMTIMGFKDQIKFLKLNYTERNKKKTRKPRMIS